MTISIDGYIIKPTIFPDKTQQVWKLPEDILRKKWVDVDWEFENDQELMTILQLSKLVKIKYLNCPFLPYGRQDKEISNNTTFGLISFCDVINLCYPSCFVTMDMHSGKAADYLTCDLINKFPKKEINFAISDCNADIICYPDHGAKNRYSSSIQYDNFNLIKIRDQQTGEITGLKIENDVDITDKRVIIIDDICDGGRTFIEAAKILKRLCREINLYVTHGIFSRGTQVLYDSGIKNIYTRKGKVDESIIVN